MPLYVDESTWQTKLQDMAQRNEAVDLSPSPDLCEEGKIPTFRVRMLHMDKKSMLVEYPTTPEAIKLFRVDETVRITTGMQATRWEIYVKVVGRVKLKLNASKHIAALQLTLPDKVKAGQRRDYFRAPTSAMDVQKVVLFPIESRDSHPMDPDLRKLLAQTRSDTAKKNLHTKKKPSLEGQPFTGSLLNISGAGIGIAVRDEIAATIAVNQWFWIQIDLPTSDEPIHAFAQIVRMDAHTAEVYHVGLSLDWPDPVAAKESVEHIVRFTTWVQRSQLKKRRDG